MQRYLDGNRDVSLRKELASAELASARRLLSHGDGTQQRSEAMRCVRPRVHSHSIRPAASPRVWSAR